MIPLFRVNMPAGVDQPLLDTLHSGYVTEGPKVKEFEKRLGQIIGNDKIAAVNSGTSALTLALRLAGVGPGNEVITTPMTCSATNLPILNAYAVPVWADVDYRTGNIDPASIESLITERTKAIMIVDWGGLPCDLHAIMKIARKHGLRVIEDAAHAFGAKFDGKFIGSIADFTCFSFQAIKHITTIDGGAIACLDQKDYERAKRLRWFGIDRESPAKDTRIDLDIEEAGYKFHMNDVAATIGLVGLETINKIIKRRQQIAIRYAAELPMIYDRPPVPTSWVESAFWLYTITMPAQWVNDFKTFMIDRGIAVSKVHRRNDTYSVFKKWSGQKLHGLDRFYDSMMCIPIHEQMTDDEVKTVIDAANGFAAERGAS